MPAFFAVAAPARSLGLDPTAPADLLLGPDAAPRAAAS
jgi:hypothetical protein